MKKIEQPMDSLKRERIPQLKIRSGVSAGASLENCLQNLEYWQKEYQKMCGGH